MLVRIPHEVRDYDRNVVFGLKPKQVFYGIITIFIITVIYFQFDFFPTLLRYLLIILITFVGCGFMFFNFRRWIEEQLIFMNSPKNIGFLDRKALDFIEVAEIRDSLVYMKDGSLKAIIKVQPINFSVLDEKQQKAIFEGYKNFVNSLSGSSSLDMVPIQILIKTHNLSLDEFFESMRKNSKATKNPKIMELTGSFENFFKRKIKEEKPNYRTFNVVISVDKNEKVWDSKNLKNMVVLLEQRVKTIMDGLGKVGLIPKRLEDDELINLYSSFFSPLSEFTSLYMKPLTLHKDWGTELEASELLEISDKSKTDSKNSMPMPLLDFLVSPSYINTTRDHIRINDKHYRTITISGYPDVVSLGFMEPLINADGIFHISMHIKPTNFTSLIDYYNSLYEKQTTDIATEQAAGKIVPYSQIIQHREIARLIRVLTKGSERAFMLSIYILIEAKNLEKLDLLTDSIIAKVNECRLKPTMANGKMDLGFKTTLPLKSDALSVFRNMTTSSIAACFPFISTLFEPHADGILFGRSKSDRMPIICDVFSKTFTNANGLILGTSGSGKSFGVKTIIKRGLQQGINLIVLDPSNEGEYETLTKFMGGIVIEFSVKSDVFINPFQIYGQSYEEKIFFLHHLMKFFVSNLTDEMRDLLDDAFEAVYKKAGINQNPKTWGRKAPTFVDLYNYLDSRARINSSKRAEVASMLAIAIRRFSKRSYSFMNKQTNIEGLDDRFITFKIGSLPNDTRKILMFIILEFIYNKIKKDLSKKFLVIDEAWRLLQNEDEEGYVLTIIKTCRHHNLGLILVTQDTYDLLTSRAGKAVMANTAWQLLLRMKPTVIDDVGGIFKLNETAKEFLLTAEPGNGLLFINNTFIPLENSVDEEEYKIFTTHPQDLNV